MLNPPQQDAEPESRQSGSACFHPSRSPSSSLARARLLAGLRRKDASVSKLIALGSAVVPAAGFRRPARVGDVCPRDRAKLSVRGVRALLQGRSARTG